MLIKKSANWLAAMDYLKLKDTSVMNDHYLTQVANICFSNNKNEEYARVVLEKLNSYFKDYGIGRYDIPNFISLIIKLHPITALEIFLEDDEIDCGLKDAIGSRFDDGVCPLSEVKIETVIAWCQKEPNRRFTKVAAIISPFTENDDLVTWSALSLQLIALSPTPISVLDELTSNLLPMSCSGSRAKIMEDRLPLFETLLLHDNSQIADWAKVKKGQWERFVAEEYEREREEESRRNEAFEW